MWSKLLQNLLLEQFSIECRTTKTKVITLANHKLDRQSSEPMNESKLKANTCSRRKAWEKVCKGVMIGFGSPHVLKVASIFQAIT